MNLTRRALLAGALGLAACGRQQEGPRALTAEEAEQLAVIRLTNYERGTSPFTATVPIGPGTMLVDGRVDWPGNVGYAVAHDPAGGRQLLQWTPARIAIRPEWQGVLPEHPPPTGWLARPPERTAPFDAALLLILALGHDRPENAELLRQNGARRLRAETRHGERLTVFQGPGAESRIRYWVDPAGGLRRVEARIGDAGTTVIELPPG